MNLLQRNIKVWTSALTRFYLTLLEVENSRRLEERVDRVALLLFPLIFLVFNLVYWPYYLLYSQNKL